MTCKDVRENLSSYLDRAMAWEQEVALRRHLAGCVECSEAAGQLQGVRELVARHGRVEPPADLALRIRLQVSHRSQLTFWNRLGVRLDNILRPVAIPATAGLLATLLTFGVMMHTFFARPLISEDVPVSLTTPPRLRTSPSLTFNTGEEGIVIETNVDAQGRVVDYRVIVGPRDPRQLSELRSILVFTQFEPATLFGKPTYGRTVINFRRLSVKG
jgi:anti-sigma factor (TIGR02949 family)